MEGSELVETSLWGSLPSLLARYRSVPFAYTNFCPSGDQEPEWPEMSPSRRGDPPNTGMIQNGRSSNGYSSVTRRSEPSGEMFRSTALLNGVRIGIVSPPEVDTAARVA